MFCCCETVDRWQNQTTHANPTEPAEVNLHSRCITKCHPIYAGYIYIIIYIHTHTHLPDFTPKLTPLNLHQLHADMLKQKLSACVPEKWRK